MVQSQRSVRILMLGEPGVGKTSLILSLVSEEFPESVPARSEDITIPADVTPERVPTHIVDYSSLVQTDSELLCEITRAHVVCVVYAVDEQDSLDKVTDSWLPLLRSTLGEHHCTPVVLVGNKVDMVDYSTLEYVMPIMNEFSEIETCVECSARTLKNITELFYYAQKAILYPTSPLYCVQTAQLTDTCKSALTRIFKICDLNNDRILSDEELNMFQLRCFNCPLQAGGLADVKHIVSQHVRHGVSRDGLTVDGFVFLHCLFVQRGRLETTWTVLRKFGYQDELTLSANFLCPELNIGAACFTELSDNGVQFLQALFDKHDLDDDGCLDETELSDLFSTCDCQPCNNAVYNSVPTDHRGQLTLDGFLCQWNVWASLTPSLALRYLAQLGYHYIMDQPHTSALAVSGGGMMTDTVQQQRHSARTVLVCHVLGPSGVGKTAFCQALLGKSTQSWRGVSEIPCHSINSVPVYGNSKYLLMREIHSDREDTVSHCRSVSGDSASCDVMCVLYDASSIDGFCTAAHIYTSYVMRNGGVHIPCLFVANKTDIDVASQAAYSSSSSSSSSSPAQFCRSRRLPLPVAFSCSSPRHIRRDVFVRLATMAAYPRSRDGVGGFWSRDNAGYWGGLGSLSLAGMGLVAAVLCGGLLLVRYAGVGVAKR